MSPFPFGRPLEAYEPLGFAGFQVVARHLLFNILLNNTATSHTAPPTSQVAKFGSPNHLYKE